MALGRVAEVDRIRKNEGFPSGKYLSSQKLWGSARVPALSALRLKGPQSAMRNGRVDFKADRLEGGRPFRVLTVIDQFYPRMPLRTCLRLRSLPSAI